MIEVKSGVRDPEPKVKIRNLIKMANRGSEEEDVREVGLLFVPPKEYPLFFRLDGGAKMYADRYEKSLAAFEANVTRGRKGRSEASKKSWETRRSSE